MIVVMVFEKVVLPAASCLLVFDYGDGRSRPSRPMGSFQGGWRFPKPSAEVVSFRKKRGLAVPIRPAFRISLRLRYSDPWRSLSGVHRGFGPQSSGLVVWRVPRLWGRNRGVSQAVGWKEEEGRKYHIRFIGEASNFQINFFGGYLEGQESKIQLHFVWLAKPNIWSSLQILQLFGASPQEMNAQEMNESVLLPVTVSKQLSLFLDKAFTNHHHPL